MLKSYLVADDRCIARRDDGRTHAIAFGHIANPEFRPHHLATGREVAGLGTWAVERQKVETPWAQIVERSTPHVQKVVERGAPMLRAIQQSVARLEKEKAAYMQPSKAFSDVRELLLVQEAERLGTPAKIIEWAHGDEDRTFVAMRHAPRFGLDADGLERSFLAAAIRRSFERSSTRSPTRADPLGKAPNFELARSLADTTLAALDATQADIDTAANWLARDVTNHVSLLSDRPADAIWNMIVEKAA